VSNLINLISLGIDATQSYQIYKASEQLGHIEEEAMTAAAHQALLEVLRNFVFQSSQDLQALTGHLEELPQPVYVATQTLQWRFRDIGISAEIFPEFTDKEYVLQVQKELDGITQDARSKLSGPQINQAEKCINAITQMPLLEQAIEAQSAREQLQATETEWRERASRKGKYTLAGLGAWAIIAFLIVPCSCSMMGSSSGTASSDLAVIFWLALSLLFLITIPAGFIGGIILWVKGSTPRYKELKKLRQEWAEQVPDRATWEKIVATFGKHSSDEYRAVRASRENTIQQVLGQVQEFDKFLPAAS